MYHETKRKKFKMYPENKKDFGNDIPLTILIN